MGFDEHGPAYPEPRDHVPVILTPGKYSLDHGLTWHTGDDFLKMLQHADRTLMPETATPEPPFWQRALIWLVVAAALLYLFTPVRAPAMNHGFDPDDVTVKWMESLQRPNMPGSCCGKGDGYPVEDYWQNKDKVTGKPTGTWTAVIGDGSAKKYPDGTTRQYVPTGYHVIVPDELVNKMEDDLDNPTDVSWVFMTAGDGVPRTVYCLIRHPNAN